MAVVRIDLEVKSDGGAAIKTVASAFEETGRQAKSAGETIQNGFLERIGHQAADAMVSALRAIPAAMMSSIAATVEYGGKLTDLAARTGIGVEAQQKLAYAGSLVGVSFEKDVVPAIGKMQKALIDTPEKFDRIGLSAQALRAMKPEDQFAAIAERIGGIADPAQRSAAAMEIFGKSGTTLLPLLTGNLKDTMAAAEALGMVMSAAVAGAADDLGDSVGTLSAVWVGLTHNIGAAIVTSEPLHQLIQGLTQILGSFSKEVGSNQAFLRSWVDLGVILVAKGLVALVDGIGYAIDAWAALKVGLAAIVLGFESVSIWAEMAAKAVKEPINTLVFYDQAIDQQAAAQKRFEEATKTAIDASTKQQVALGGARKMVEDLEKAITAADGVQHKAADSAAKHGAALEQTGKQIKGAQDAQDKYNKALNDNMQQEVNIFKEGQKEQAKYFKDLDDNMEEEVRIFKQGKKEEAAAAKEAAEAIARAVDESFQEWERAAQKALAQNQEFVASIRDIASSLLDMGDAVGGAFGGILSMGGAALNVFANLNDKALQSASTMAKVGMAVQGAVAAYKSGSVLGGAAQGAAAGAAFGGVGAVVGGLVGGVLGFFGGKKKKREEERKRKEAEAQQQAKDEEEAQQRRTAGIATAVKGLEQHASGFSMMMERAGEVTAQTQGAFDRLGIQAAATFSEMVRQTGDIPAALAAIGPALDILVETQAKYGLEVGAGLAQLLAWRAVAVDNADVFESMSGITQQIRGMGDAVGANTPLFNSFGQDVVANFDELIGRGVDYNTALAMTAPTLQALWEHQRKFGDITDEATLSLLDQAETAGTVGVSMMDVNKQVLEVLLAIAQVLGADLPAAFDRTRRSGEDAMNGIGTAAREAAREAANVPGSGGGAPSGSPPRPGGVREDDIPGHAVGTGGERYIPPRPGGYVFRMSEAGQGEYLNVRTAGQGPSNTGGQDQVEELRALRADMAAMMRSIPRAMRDAVQMAQ